MTTATVYDDQDTRMAAWHGLRASEAVPCPRTVARKRCRARFGERCECASWLMDHARIWLDDDGRHVLTTEPYGSDGMDLADFIHRLDALGLNTTVTGASPWNPGSTYCVVVRKSP
jgi:hypothetical protein